MKTDCTQCYYAVLAFRQQMEDSRDLSPPAEDLWVYLVDSGSGLS